MAQLGADCGDSAFMCHGNPDIGRRSARTAVTPASVTEPRRDSSVTHSVVVYTIVSPDPARLARACSRVESAIPWFRWRGERGIIGAQRFQGRATTEVE